MNPLSPRRLRALHPEWCHGRACLPLVLMHMLLITLVAVVLVTSQPVSSLS